MARANYIIEICITSNDADVNDDDLAKNQCQTHNVQIYAPTETEAITLAIEKCQKVLLDLPDEEGNTKFTYEHISTAPCPVPTPGYKRKTLEELKAIDRTEKERIPLGKGAFLHKGKQSQGELND